jgi:hypothetical protein
LVAFAKEVSLWQALQAFLGALSNEITASVVGDDGLSALSTPSFMVWTQLFKLISSSLKSEIDRFNRYLVPVFLDTWKRQDEVQMVAVPGEGEDGEALEDNASEQQQPIRYGRLIEWLKLFGAFANVKGIHQLPRLQAICEELIASPSGHVQSLALAVVLKWDASKLLDGTLPSQLLALADGKSMLDAMVRFPLEELSEPAVRHRVVDIVTRLLYPRVRALAARRAQVLVSRRHAMLLFLARLEEEELGAFMDLLFTPLAGDLQHLEPRQLLADATLALDSWLQLRLRAARYYDRFAQLAVRLLSQNDECYSIGLALLHGLIDVCPSKSLASFSAALSAALTPRLHRLASESVEEPSPLFRLLVAASEFCSMDAFFAAASVVPCVLNTVTNKSSAPVLEAALLFLARLLPRDSADTDEAAADDDDDDDDDERLVVVHSAVTPQQQQHRLHALVKPHLANILHFLEASTTLLQVLGGPGRLLGALRFTIVLRLSRHVESSAHVRDFMNLVLPMLEAPSPESHDEQQAFVRGLTLVDSLSHALTAADCERHLPRLLALVTDVGGLRAPCQRLCATLKGLCKRHLPHLSVASATLADMLSFSQVMLDQVDVNRRRMGLENAMQMATEMNAQDIEHQRFR